MSIQMHSTAGKPPLSKKLKPHQKAILAAGVVSLVLWAVPFLHNVLLPLTYLNTHLHELAHALAGQASGGDVEQIRVMADGNGATPISGGSMWLIGPAGYVGAAVIGAAVIWFSRTDKSAQATLRVLALLLGLGMALWVRGDAIGIVFGGAWMLALLAASTYLKGGSLLFFAQFVGLQQCLNSIQAVYVLLNLSAFSESHSDAKIMERYTGIPALGWALIWCAISLVLVYLSLRHAWSKPAK